LLRKVGGGRYLSFKKRIFPSSGEAQGLLHDTRIKVKMTGPTILSNLENIQKDASLFLRKKGAALWKKGTSLPRGFARGYFHLSRSETEESGRPAQRVRKGGRFGTAASSKPSSREAPINSWHSILIPTLLRKTWGMRFLESPRSFPPSGRYSIRLGERERPPFLERISQRRGRKERSLFFSPSRKKEIPSHSGKGVLHEAPCLPL